MGIECHVFYFNWPVNKLFVKIPLNDKRAINTRLLVISVTFVLSYKMASITSNDGFVWATEVWAYKETRAALGVPDHQLM